MKKKILSLVLLFMAASVFVSAQNNASFHKVDSITFRGGGKMYYEMFGAGEPVIFVHGHTLDRREWAPQVEALRNKYLVITPDSRGYGLSADPEEGYQFTHADDIIDLMDSLHIEKAHVVGLSMGGFVCGDLLGMYPDRLLSSVMVSGEMNPGGSSPSRPKSAATVAEEKKKRHAWHVDEAAYKRSRANYLISIGGSHRESMRAAITPIIMDWGLWQNKHSTCRIYYGRDAWVKFKANPPKTPYLIVYGDHEKKKGYKSPLLNVAPQGRVEIIEDCGHMVNMERPDVFNKLLLDWLQECDSKR